MKTTSSEVNRGGAASQPAGESAHTPTPWQVMDDNTEGRAQILAIIPVNGHGVVCRIPSAGMAPGEQEANAAFIARAANSHAAYEALAEKADELERCADLLACAKDRDEHNRRTLDLATAQYEYRQARAALALAKSSQ